MILSTDQLGHTLTLASVPRRIISLVPSQTELLFDLGLADSVVGVTRFCTRPPAGVREKTRVGGTKNFQFEIIDALRPDLIIGNKEENAKEGIDRLKVKYPVWMSDISSLSEALAMIGSVGAITDTGGLATQWAARIRSAFDAVVKTEQKSVLYLIWKKPWMAAGKNTFIDAMLESSGLVNCLAQNRYPELTLEAMQALAPEVILLSSEPYPFRERHRQELAGLFPSASVVCVEGEMFSWYGSRLALAPAYFEGLRRYY
jgi:ABC-type Fe3+-hydroxamate transport system substrate-binding protein